MKDNFKQLTIFDVMKQNDAIDLKEKIKSKLKDYNIDEIYLNNFKGKSETLNIILKSLQKDKHYNEYLSKLIKELIKYYPLLENCLFSENKKGIWDSKQGWYIYCMPNESGPIYCLEMIPDEFFEDDYDNR